MDRARQSERKSDVWRGHPLYRLYRNSGAIVVQQWSMDPRPYFVLSTYAADKVLCPLDR
jgi:hypothetical protein